jgi:hypothetical protein
MQPSGNPYLDYYRSAPAATAGNAVATSRPQNQGLLRSIYNDTFGPVVNTVAGAPSDAFHALHALGIAGGSVISGQHGAALDRSKQQALDELNRAPMFRQANLPTTMEGINNMSGLQGLEKIGGATASNLLNVASIAPAGRILKEASLAKRLGQGARLGAAYGAGQGAANAMQQGQGPGDVGYGAFAGGVTGGLAGGALTGVGSGVGALLRTGVAKNFGRGLAGETVSNAISGGVKTAQQKSSNLFDRFATKQANQVYQQKIMDQLAPNGATVGAVGAKGKSDGGIGVIPILSEMQKHGFSADNLLPEMARYGDAGRAYNNIADELAHQAGASGTGVKFLDPTSVMDNALKKQPLAKVTNEQASRLTSGMKAILDQVSAKNQDAKYLPQGYYTPRTLKETASEMYNIATEGGADAKMLEAMRQELRNEAATAGSQTGASLNDLIAKTKLPTVEKLNDPQVAGTREGKMAAMVLEQSSGNQSVANEIINNVNRAKSFPELQGYERPHIAASQIAEDHAAQLNQQLPRNQNPRYSGQYSFAGNGGISTAYELGMLGHGNLGALFPLAAKVNAGRPGLSNPLARMIASAGTVDESQVGLKPAPDLGAGTPGNVPDVNPQAEPGTAPSPQPSGPVVIPEASPTKIGFTGQSGETPVPTRTPTTITQGPKTARFQLGGQTIKVNNYERAPLQGFPTTETTGSQAYLNNPTRTPTTIQSVLTPGLSQADAQAQRAQLQSQLNTAPAPAPAPELAPTTGEAASQAVGLKKPLTNFLGRLTPAAGGTMDRIRNTATGAIGAGQATGLAQPSPVADTSNASSFIPGTALAGAGQAMSGAGSSPSDPFSEQSIRQDILNDPKNTSTYLEAYKTFNPGSTKAPLTTAQTTEAMGIQNAVGGINNYIKDLQSAQKAGVTGYGTGPLASFMGKVGIGGQNESQAYALDTTKVDLATQLARAIGGGKATSTQIKQWEDSMPSIQDSPSDVEQKLNILMSNLNTYYNNATTPIGVASGQ